MKYFQFSPLLCLCLAAFFGAGCGRSNSNSPIEDKCLAEKNEARREAVKYAFSGAIKIRRYERMYPFWFTDSSWDRLKVLNEHVETLIADNNFQEATAYLGGLHENREDFQNNVFFAIEPLVGWAILRGDSGQRDLIDRFMFNMAKLAAGDGRPHDFFKMFLMDAIFMTGDVDSFLSTAGGDLESRWRDSVLREVLLSGKSEPVPPLKFPKKT